MKVQLLLLISAIATVAASANYATWRREHRPPVEEANATTIVKSPKIIKVSRSRNVRIDSGEDVLPVDSNEHQNQVQIRHHDRFVNGKDTEAINRITRKDTAQRRASNNRTQNSRSMPNRTHVADLPPITSFSNESERHRRRKTSYTLILTDSKEEPSITTTTRAPTNPPITTTTVAATRTSTTPRPNFWDNFMFTLFPTNFWNFVNQHESVETTTTPLAPNLTRKPPKKFLPSVTPTTKEEKSNYRKAFKTNAKHSNVLSTTTTTTQRALVDGPFRIALPTLNFPSSSNANEKDKRATSVAQLRAIYNCPIESEVRFQLFPKICKEDKDCSIWKRDELCCEIFGAKSCVSGMPKPLEETAHAPILGLIPRKCPTRPLAELWWDVKECHSDMDCWPRVCCPDGRRRYCRTSQPELETAPVQVKRSFNYLTEYLECTPPPPPIFDLHPKACTSTLDCFPNVCCQEAGLRHCRPPKKSVLTLMANFLNVDFVKRLAQNIVIK